MRIASHYRKKEKNVKRIHSLRTERISRSLDYWYDFSNIFAIEKLLLMVKIVNTRLIVYIMKLQILYMH